MKALFRRELGRLFLYGAVAGPAGVRARAPAGFERGGAPHATPAEPHVSATAPSGRSGSSSTALDAPGVAGLEGGFEPAERDLASGVRSSVGRSSAERSSRSEGRAPEYDDLDTTLPGPVALESVDAGTESAGDPASDGADDHGSSSLPDLYDLEVEAALAALSLGLVDPVEVERRVALAVPEGTLPPGEIDTARQDARREILADAAIVEALARERFGPDASEAQMALARGLGQLPISREQGGKLRTFERLPPLEHATTGQVARDTISTQRRYARVRQRAAVSAEQGDRENTISQRPGVDQQNGLRFGHRTCAE